MAKRTKINPEVEDAEVVDLTTSAKNVAGEATKPATSAQKKMKKNQPKPAETQGILPVAKRAKIKPEIEDAEVVDQTTSAKNVAGKATKPTTSAQKKMQKNQPKPAETPTSKSIGKPDQNVGEDSSDDNDIRTSLSTVVLGGLFFVFIGVIIALWGAPRLAPLLPSGLAPVAAFLMPGQSQAEAEIDDVRTTLNDYIADTSAAATDFVDQEAVNKAIATYSDSQGAELSAIKSHLAVMDGRNIETRIATMEAQVEELNANILIVGEQVKLQISENRAALSQNTDSNLPGLKTVLDEMKTQISDLTAKNAALSQQLEQLPLLTNAKEAQRTASSEAVNTTAKELTFDIAIALENGSPFKSTLDRFSGITDVDIPEALSRVAQSGTPSWNNLRNSFSEAAHDALRAESKTNSGDGVGGRFIAFLKAQVSTRSLERTDGSTTNAVLSRVEDELTNRRLSAALREAETLQGASRTAMKSWINDLANLNAAQTALGEFITTIDAT